MATLWHQNLAMNILIGLAGAKQSGKSTVARIFSEQLPSYKYTEIAFADSLKDEVCETMKITRGHLELHKIMYRGLLQWWGTEYRRSTNPNYWIDKWLVKMSLPLKEQPNNNLIIAPDVRFENEYSIMKILGAYIFKVNRPSNREDKHLSEISLLHAPIAAIDNSKDLEYLEQQIKLIIGRMKV